MIPFVCVPYFRSISPNHICNAHKIGVEKLGILWEQHWYYKTKTKRRQKDKMAKINKYKELARSKHKQRTKRQKVFWTEHCQKGTFS